MMLRRIFALAALILLCAQSPISSFPPGSFTGRAALSGGGGGNTWTLVTNGLAGATVAPSVTVNTTGASIVYVAVSQFNGITIGTLTDSKSNTWIGLTARIGPAEAYNRIFYCAPCTVGSGHVFTWDNGTSIFGALAIQAWSGSNVSPFDVQNGAVAAAGVKPIQPGSVTPSQNNSLIITSVDPTGATTAASYTVDSGFTITDSINAQPGIEGLAMGYLVQSTAGAVNPSWSWTGTSNDSAATIAVFKP